jgi:cyclic pyranopterin monophosphate synthase
MNEDEYGPRMVDISSKAVIEREAVAEGRIRLKHDTISLIKKGRIEKGDPITTAKIAGILAAKSTSSIIPLCHPISITNIEISLNVLADMVVVNASVKATAKTGVEMEALTAVAASLLTVWDMVKQYEKDEAGQYPITMIEDLHVLKKIKKG